MLSALHEGRNEEHLLDYVCNGQFADVLSITSTTLATIFGVIQPPLALQAHLRLQLAASIVLRLANPSTRSL